MKWYMYPIMGIAAASFLLLAILVIFDIFMLLVLAFLYQFSTGMLVLFGYTSVICTGVIIYYDKKYPEDE